MQWAPLRASSEHVCDAGSQFQLRYESEQGCRVYESGNTFGSTVDGLEEFGSGGIETKCGFVIGHGGGHGIELSEGDVGLEASCGVGQRAQLGIGCHHVFE